MKTKSDQKVTTPKTAEESKKLDHEQLAEAQAGIAREAGTMPQPEREEEKPADSV